MNEQQPLDVKDRHISFIVKSTFDCNLRCAYCYEGHNVKGQRMALDTVQALISKASEQFKQTGAKSTFIWHGGEPLMMGAGFYKKAAEMQRAEKTDFVSANCLQTNGVLLTKDTAKMLVDNKFSVGVSLDGPPIIHDAQRVLCGNRSGSFMQSYEALRTLYDLGVQAGALAVFTKNTYNHLDEFYHFFSERELPVKMNPLFIAGSAKDESSQNLRITPREYKKALIYLFDRWTADTTKDFDFDPFSKFIRSMTSGNTYSCCQSGSCPSFFKVFPNGDMHLCGLQPYDQYKLGNIHQNSMAEIMASPLRKSYAQARASLETKGCKGCDDFSICRGGCVSYSYPLHNRHSDKTYFCASFKGLFNHMRDKVAEQKALYARMNKQKQQSLLSYT